MPSATRTTMAVAAAVPLLLLAGGQPHQGSAPHPSAPPIPINCFVTSTLTYGSDVAGLPDLEAIRADLAQQAADFTATQPGANTPDVWQVGARAEAMHALSQPGVHHSVGAGSLHLTAYDDYGRMIAKADYGSAGQVFLDPTPADGYLLQALTYPVEPLPGHKNCATSTS